MLNASYCKDHKKERKKKRKKRPAHNSNNLNYSKLNLFNILHKKYLVFKKATVYLETSSFRHGISKNTQCNLQTYKIQKE